MTFDFASLESAILGSTLPGTVVVADVLGVTRRTVNRYRVEGATIPWSSKQAGRYEQGSADE